MIFDTIQLLNGAKLTNVVVDSGSSFPSNPDEGEIFFKTTDSLLYVYNGTSWVTTTGSGSVTSVDIGTGSTGLTATGGPISTSGTITLGGTLAITNGGTGQTTASGAINALVPSQTGNTGKVLKTDGSAVSWTTSVSSLAGTANQITVSGSTGDVTLSLPSSVTISGTLSGAAVSVASVGEFAGASLVTSTTTANQIVDTAAVATYRALKYNVTVTSGSAYQFTEIYLMHDGTTAYINQVATMRSGSNLATFDADISGGNLRLLVTPVNAATTVKALRTAVKI